MKSTGHSNCRPGFTLIELLVVIAIIAILAALLLPSLTNAKWTDCQVIKQAGNFSNYDPKSGDLSWMLSITTQHR